MLLAFIACMAALRAMMMQSLHPAEGLEARLLYSLTCGDVHPQLGPLKMESIHVTFHRWY